MLGILDPVWIVTRFLSQTGPLRYHKNTHQLGFVPGTYESPLLEFAVAHKPIRPPGPVQGRACLKSKFSMIPNELIVVMDI